MILINRICQLSAILLLTSIFFGCNDDDSKNRNIPLVETNFTLNIGDPDYIKLQNIGGWVEIPSYGSRGVILYRLSTEKIMAYDKHCTFQPSNTCAIVTVDATNITASDQCCGSSFLLSSGNVSQPPAVTPLKQYNTSFDGTTLLVTN